MLKRLLAATILLPAAAIAEEVNVENFVRADVLFAELAFELFAGKLFTWRHRGVHGHEGMAVIGGMVAYV